MADSLDIDTKKIQGDVRDFIQTLGMHEPPPHWLENGLYNSPAVAPYVGNGAVFIPGSYFRTHYGIGTNPTGSPVISFADKKDKLDPRIVKLKEVAKSFREAADLKICPTPESAQTYLKAKHKKMVAKAEAEHDKQNLTWLKNTKAFDISLEDVQAIRGDNQVKKEAFYAKTFHRNIHDVFGDYNPEVSLALRQQSAKMGEAVKHWKFKEDGSVDRTETDQVQSIFSKTIRGIVKVDDFGTERIKTVGREEGLVKPFCIHYAPVMSMMLDSAGIENCTMTHDNHITVVSLRTSHIFETTARDPEDNYHYAMSMEKPDLMNEGGLFYYVTKTGYVSNVDLSSIQERGNPDNMERNYISEAVLNQQAVKMGRDKFGQAVADAIENGKSILEIPAVAAIKSLPEEERPKIDPEFKKLLDKAREFRRKFSAPPEELPGEPKPDEDKLELKMKNGLGAVNVSNYDYGRLTPSLPRVQTGAPGLSLV